MKGLPTLRAACAVGLVLASLASARPARADTYYVDARTGDDAAAGTSPAHAWRGLANLGKRRFLPGDSILFARGSRYTGGVTLTSSGEAGRPIVFGAYGTGPAPSFTNPDWNVLDGSAFRVLGNWIVVEGLHFHDMALPPPPDRSNLNVQRMGAVYVERGADHVVVRDCEFFRAPVGVKLKGSLGLVTHNYLHDAPEPLGRTWGAIAIMVVGPHNIISYNTIERYGYFGGAYASDGGAIELDGVDPAADGRDLLIDHNISRGNHGFLELATRTSDSVRVTGNVSDDVDKFIGGGAMGHLIVEHNTVLRTREPNADPYVFWTFYPAGTSARIQANIFVLAPGLRVFDAADTLPGHHRRGIGDQPHEGNVYFVDRRVRVDSAALAALRADGGPRADSALARTDSLMRARSSDRPLDADPIGVAAGRGDRIADPGFLDAGRGDFRLRPGSPAAGAGAHPIPVAAAGSERK